MRWEVYCIYTDRDVADGDGNYDHIIPLSLGGDDKFVVWSNATYNSEVGSKIDGKLANDQLIMFARRKADARGHSGIEPVPIWRRSELEGRPVQVSWGDEVKVWDAKARAYLDPSDFADKQMASNWQYDISARSRFTAKVALGAGYFLFKDSFAKAADCDELRKLILAEDVTKVSTTLVAHDPVLKGRWPDNTIDAYRLSFGSELSPSRM